MNSVLTPKRNGDAATQKNELYSFYASYSRSFALDIVNSLELPKTSLILDPWNGSGTTTYASSLMGYTSMGIDLNPVMTIVSRVRNSTQENISYARESLSSLNANYKVKIDNSDPLSSWFSDYAIMFLRKVEKFILKENYEKSFKDKLSFLMDGKAILYLALFNVIRKNSIKFVSSNPTWIKKAKTVEEKVNLEWKYLKNEYESEVGFLCDILEGEVGNKRIREAKIINASSCNIPLDDETVDFVLTSPPYCTRIDYAVATSPELALLCNSSDDILKIRRSLMGTTTVPKKIDSAKGFGEICEKFLGAVLSHQSHASGTYYYKNLYQYFSELKKSIKEIARVLKSNSRCVIVVQDSFYKNVHCDLSGMIIEMFQMCNVRHDSTKIFYSKNNMANINSRSKKYRDKSDAYENVLFFTKEKK